MMSTPNLWQRRTTTRFATGFYAPTTLALAFALVSSAAGCGGSGGKTTPDGGGGGSGGGGSGGGTTDAGGGSGGGTTDAGGDTSTACAVGGSGQLVLAVVGLPVGTTPPMVRVEGPALMMPMPLTVGTPVTLDARGGYEIFYRRVKTAPTPGGIVGKAFYVSANSFDGCVKSGSMATATLTYTQEPGSEHMWITVSNAPTLGNEIAGYADADLVATATKAPALWKTKNFTGRGAAGAFDSFGNFWVPGGNLINEYRMKTLDRPGMDPPMVVLTQPTTAAVKFAAFDSDGNLWATRGNPGTESSIVRYTPADQAASGAPTPSVVITSPDLMNPAGLAFDSNRDLWVASEGNGKVLRFNAENLSATYAGAANIVLTSKTPAGAPVASTYSHPNGIAFDQAGNLWVGYLDELVGFTTTQQAASADIAGPLAVNVSTGTGGFAFDESGGLWFSNNVPSTFQRVAKASLMAGGDVTPDIVITSADLGYAESLVLDPSPTWSRIQDWQ
jgi:hypothetical protein